MIDNKTVRHVAHLAKLSITDQETELFATQLSGILGAFEELAVLDVKSIKPLLTPSPIEPYLRADETKQSLTPEQIIANAPERAGHLFKVPPVV